MTKHIHIIGPFNTGTNLLHNIISNCDVVDSNNNESIFIDSDVHKPINKHTLIINDINNYLLGELTYRELYKLLNNEL